MPLGGKTDWETNKFNRIETYIIHVLRLWFKSYGKSQKQFLFIKEVIRKKIIDINDKNITKRKPSTFECRV